MHLLQPRHPSAQSTERGRLWRPRLAREGPPKRTSVLEVSLERQVVEVYERNVLGAYDLVQTFTCSTGLHDTTPRGIFLDGHPLNRWHFFKKFYCWAQYSFEIEGDILFHSVIYSSNNENSLRRGSLSALGNPASHGCVRLQVADAKWLFEHCKLSENVIVSG